MSLFFTVCVCVCYLPQIWPVESGHTLSKVSSSPGILLHHNTCPSSAVLFSLPHTLSRLSFKSHCCSSHPSPPYYAPIGWTENKLNQVCNWLLLCTSLPSDMLPFIYIHTHTHTHVCIFTFSHFKRSCVVWVFFCIFNRIFIRHFRKSGNCVRAERDLCMCLCHVLWEQSLKECMYNCRCSANRSVNHRAKNPPPNVIPPQHTHTHTWMHSTR